MIRKLENHELVELINLFDYIAETDSFFSNTLLTKTIT